MARRKRPIGTGPLTRSESGRIAARARWNKKQEVRAIQTTAADEPTTTSRDCFGPMGRAGTFPYCNCGRHMLEPGHQPGSLAARIQQLDKPAKWERR
jgi:hypothetical protein